MTALPSIHPSAVPAYRLPEYATSLAEFGTPLPLSLCNGWLLKRPILDTPWHDAMGCYPIFGCGDWNHLGDDLDQLTEQLVAVSLVADPFGNHTENLLSRCFDDVRAFKRHFIVDLRQPLRGVVTRHHQKCADRALSRIAVDLCRSPYECLDDWLKLFDGVVKRYDLAGIKAFSRVAFAQQLSLPGVVMFRATLNEDLVAAQLWFVDKTTAYSHLVASNQQGYDSLAAFGLHWFALSCFTDAGLRWADLGGAAGGGAVNERHDGLARFKRGWASGTRIAYFCKRVLNRSRYDAIVKRAGIEETEYFPAYRRGEF
jgi:hypothetical protein